MVAEYIAKIKGDYSGLEKTVKQAQGMIKRINDDEILIKFNYDGNEKEFNKKFQSILNKHPELTVQLQYDLNKTLLEQKMQELKDLEAVKMTMDPSDIDGELTNINKQIAKTKDTIDIINEEMERLTSLSPELKMNTGLNEAQSTSGQVVDNLRQMQNEASNVGASRGIDTFASDVSDVNSELEDTKKNLEDITNLGEAVNFWHNDKTERRERYTPFNTQTREVSDATLVGAEEEISGKLIREAIEQSTIAVDGFIHSHPTLKAAFSDDDINMFFKLASDGIQEQVIVSLKEAMTLDMSKVNTGKSEEIVNKITEAYNRIDSNIENDMSEYLSEVVSSTQSILGKLKADDPAANAVLRNLEKAYPVMMKQLDEAMSLDEYREEIDRMVTVILRNTPEAKGLRGKDLESTMFALGGALDAMEAAATDVMNERAQAAYQRVLTNVFSDPAYLKEGISSAIKIESIKDFIDMNSIADASREVVRTAQRAMADEQDSHSSSKVAEQLGEYWGEGYAKGILKHKDEVEDAVRELVRAGKLTTEDLLKDQANIASDEHYSDLVLPVAKAIESELDKKAARIDYLVGRIQTLYQSPTMGKVDEDRLYNEMFNTDEVKELIGMLSSLSDAEQEALGVHNYFEEGGLKAGLDTLIARLIEARNEMKDLMNAGKTSEAFDVDEGLYTQMSNLIDMGEKVASAYRSKINPAVEEFLGMVKSENEAMFNSSDINKYVDEIIDGGKTAREAFQHLAADWGWDTTEYTDGISNIVDRSEEAAEAVGRVTEQIRREGDTAEESAEKKRGFAEENEHIAEVSKPELYEDASGQLSFVKEMTEAEKKLGEAMSEVSAETKESAEQIKGQLSLDFSKGTENQEKFELAIVETNDELARMAQLASQAERAFKADTGISSIDLSKTVDDSRKLELALTDSNNEFEKMLQNAHDIATEQLRQRQLAEESAKAQEDDQQARQRIVDEYAAEELEYLDKRNRYQEEGNRLAADYAAKVKKARDAMTAEYENIFYDGKGKLRDVEFAPDTEALKNSTALYDELESTVKKVYALKEASLKLDKETLTGQYGISKIDKEIAELTERIKNIYLEINAAEAVQESRENALLELDKQRDGVLQNIINKQELQSRDQMSLQAFGWLKDVEKLQATGKYTQEFEAHLEEVKNQLKGFDAATGSIDEVNASFKNLEQTMERINIDKSLSEFKKAQSVSISKLDYQIADFMRKNTRMGRKFREEFENLKLDWDAEHSLAEVQQLADAFVKLKARVTEADKTGANFFDTLRQRAMGVNAQLIAQYLSWQDMIRYARQGFEAIHELDEALVDLKKTTAMNEVELNGFYYSANKTAKEMGVTTKAIIEQASAWSRLGYNTADTSETMAALSSQFASISPGMSTDEAQTGLVSLMKAYKVNVDDVERELMDNINVLGNKFAETNLDIIEGMERAGATLSALGTSVQDSFALFTGAQEIIQNAETVGTALKTLSLRIRGFDEETEELSDDVIEATGKVADLTKVASNNYAGVSLWADAEQTKYRSLVDYLGDIASIWDEISEKNQTALLNNLFGKRGASVGSAILKNYDQVKNALAEMENAAGAADAEMEIIKQSISYKLNELKETWVGIIQQMIERGDINKVIDALIKLSEAIGDVIEAIGPIPTLLLGLGLRRLILDLDKIPQRIDSFISLASYLADVGSKLGKSEIFIGETADAVNNLGSASLKSTGMVSKLGKALLSLAKNPLTWVALGIAAATIAFDKWQTSVEEWNDKIDETTSKIETLKDEINELQNIDFRTQDEQNRLDALEKELDYQEQLLEIEKKRAEIQKYGYDSLTEMWDKDNANNVLKEDEAARGNAGLGTVRDATLINMGYDAAVVTQAARDIAEYDRQLKGLDKDSDEYAKTLEKKEQAEIKADESLDTLITTTADYKKKIEAAQEAQKKFRKDSDEWNNAQHIIDTYSAWVAENEAAIEQYQKVLGIFDYSSTIGSVLQHVEFKNVKEQLIELAQDGSLSVDYLTAHFSDLLAVLEENGVSADELYNYILRLSGLVDRQNLSEKIANSLGKKSYDERGFEKSSLPAISDFINSLSEEDVKIVAGMNVDWSTFDAKEAIAKMQDAINNAGPLEVEVETKTESFAKLISDLEELGSKLDDVGTAMANVDEHGQFDLGDLDKIADYFLELEKSEQGVTYETEAVNAALKLLGEGTGTVQENADAINTLADNYLRTSGVLKDLTEENKAFYIGRLKNMGIINAEAVVEAELAGAVKDETQAKIVSVIQDGLLVQYKQALVDGNHDEAEAIEKKIEALLKEQDANEQTVKSVEFLINAQEIFSNQTLSVNEKIDALQKLSEAYMGTAEAAKLAAQVEALESQKDLVKGAGVTAEIRAKELAKIDAEIEKIINEAATKNTKAEYAKVEYNGGTKVKDKTGKDASSTVDALNDVIKKATDDAAKAAKESFKKTVDYFEQMIKELTNSIDLLEAHLEDVVGSFAKNNLLDAEESLIKKKMDGYSSAIDMYSQKASEALAKIPSDIAEKLLNGAVDIDEFVGESNEEVYEAIQDYQNWAEKIQDARLQLVELKEAIRQLELQKFNNIVEDFTNMFDLRQSDGIDLLQKQIELLKEAGQLIGESFYTKQIEQSQKQLDILNREKEALVSQMNEALNNGIDTGSDEWLEMVKTLSELEGKILDCKKAVEEYDNALLALHTEIFNRIQDQFGAFNNELSNLIGLLDDAEVANESGDWTSEGLAQLGLLSQQYELAKYQVQQYDEEIAKLNQDYLEGRYSATEYADKLIELKEAQWDAVNASESAKDAIVALNKARIEAIKTGMDKELDAYKKLIQAKKDELSAEKELNDYRKSIADANKSIVSLERQLAAMADDNTAASVAKRKKLEEQLAEAREALAEKEADHSYDTQVESLDKQLEAYEDLMEKEVKALEESLKDIEQILTDSFDTVRDNAEEIGQTITDLAREHGVEISDALTEAWTHGEDAIAKYGETLGSGSSAFIENLQDVESEVYELQNKANETAEGLADMFSTRADELVSELENSYNSEATLDAMTNALHNALSDTIDGHYSGAGATAALDDISEAANRVADAAREAADALRELADSDIDSDVKTYTGDIWEQGEDGDYYYAGHGTVSGKNIWRDPKTGRIYVDHGYANGTKRVSKDELAWTQEKGPEMIISPTDGSILTPLKQGDAVLPAEQTSNIWEWSKFNPEEFANKLLQAVPDVGGNVQTNTMQVGSLVTVNGNVNDTMEMVQIAAQQASSKIKQSFYQLSNGLNR